MRPLGVCFVVAIALVGISASLILLVPVANNFQLQQSPYPPLLPWWIFQPALALQDGLFDFIQATTPPFYRVMDLATAYWKSEVTYALTKNGIMDALAESPRVTCQQTAAKLQLNEHVVCEYMRAGAALGLLKEQKEGQDFVYLLSPDGRLLTTNTPGSLRDFVLLLQEETQQAWRAAGTKSIQTGHSGFLEALGSEFWDYHTQHPDKYAQFDRAMKSHTPNTMQAVLGDWSPTNKRGLICDIGGGLGTAVQLILQKHPGLKAIVFDQPDVAERAKEQLKDDNRIEAVGGSFFEALPPSLQKCDIFFMKYILHDWPDEDCITILKRIQAAAKPDAELVLVEFVVGSSNIGRIELTKRLMSINMLAGNKFGARERTLEQFQALMDRAGLGQTCDQSGACHGTLQEVKIRDIGSVLTLKL